MDLSFFSLHPGPKKCVCEILDDYPRASNSGDVERVNKWTHGQSFGWICFAPMSQFCDLELTKLVYPNEHWRVLFSVCTVPHNSCNVDTIQGMGSTGNCSVRIAGPGVLMLVFESWLHAPDHETCNKCFNFLRVIIGPTPLGCFEV